MNPTTSRHRAHLVVCSAADMDANAVQQIAKTCGISAYDARLRLKVDIPRPLATFRTMEEARQKAAALGDLGLTTITYVEEDLPPSPMWPAFRAQWGRMRIRLASREGEERIVDNDRVAMLVSGRRMSFSTSKEFTYKPPAITPSGTMLALSDIAGSAKYDTKRGVGQEHFIIAFFDDPEITPIEFSEQAFDDKCLGKHRAETKLMSHKVLVTVLRKLFKDARFDTRLLQGQSDNRGEAFYNRRIAADSSWANATLIRWEMLAQSNASRHYCATPMS